LADTCPGPRAVVRRAIMPAMAHNRQLNAVFVKASRAGDIGVLTGKQTL
jgi:hypothetical protein